MAAKQHEHDLTKRWWLPPSFGIGTVYVPLLRNGHWHLMIVDMYHSDLVYLDSMKNDEDTAERKKQMKFVAFFLETLLSDKGFYKEWDGLTPKFSTYDFSEPETGQQDELT
ncbi:hypothetical protein PIB30_084019 [Stylosanthes scabra]|uniref:Ubiquitin-like protease family profile domain-containing protein n=1 Tax=Stylosanthes scabra TaxID=79078 RepID=A0ABU6WQQ5_9FABA|nr:hypothetical protein [Stylosanthes scabra]